MCLYFFSIIFDFIPDTAVYKYFFSFYNSKLKANKRIRSLSGALTFFDLMVIFGGYFALGFNCEAFDLNVSGAGQNIGFNYYIETIAAWRTPGAWATNNH